MKKTGQIDIWYMITKVIDTFPPIYVLAFLGNKAYGQSLRKISQALDLTVADIKLWNKRIERKVRKHIKKEGVNLKSISDTYGMDYIIEVASDEEIPPDE